MARAVVENRKWSVQMRFGMVCIIADFNDEVIAQFTPINRNDAEVVASRHNAAIDMEIEEYDELLDEYTDLEIAFDEYKDVYN